MVADSGCIPPDRPPLPALLASSDFLPGEGNLNGRRWAARQLLQAWAEAAADRTISLALADPGLAVTLAPQLRQHGHRGAITTLGLSDPAPFAGPGGIFLPDPQIGRWAAWRQSVGATAFSLIGQIHTISTKGALAMLDALVVQPVQPWDALICSSTAGRQVVETVLAGREQQLASRLGASRFPRPQLPVIPLPLPREALAEPLPRAGARQALGLPPEAAVVLWLGRLSLLTKADLWSTYRVLERLAARLAQPLVLIECGPDDTSEQAANLAALRGLCTHLRFLRLGGAEPVSEAVKQQALAAADVAVSLVDNTQETFGLAVAEAMAAGLPVVASNWNGYRDLVRDGVDGFLVPSRWSPLAPQISPALGWHLELELQSYPGIAGALAQLVQLDLEAAEAALALLLSDRPLAAAMGRAGRARACTRFASGAVMAAYEALFADLAERRRAAGPPAAGSIALPQDPVRCFAGYPGGLWGPDAVLGGEPLPAAVVQGRRPLWDELRRCTPPALQEALTAELQRRHGGTAMGKSEFTPPPA